MNLDTTLRKLQIVLANAKTTNDMSVVVDYADMTSPAQTFGVTPSKSNGVSAVDILAAPAQGVQRIVQALSVSNSDTVAQTVTIQLNDNATIYPITTETLGTGETLGYTINLGWYVQDANGNRKTAASNLYTNTTSNLLGTASPKLPSIDCTQSGGALTFSAVAQYLDFRNVSLTSGTPTTVNCAPANLVLPSGGTLGAVTTVSARIVLVEMNNAGTAELAIANISGGVDMSETGLISTTAIGAGSTANNVWYSTTGRTNLAYRVIGAFDVVNTAGAWGSPTTKINAGGNALTAMSSFGYGQTEQDLVASRALGNTYYNTTGKMIEVNIASGYTSSGGGVLYKATINGTDTVWGISSIGVGALTAISFRVRPGSSYAVSVANGGTATVLHWFETR